MPAAFRAATLDDVDAVLSFWQRCAEPTSTDSADALSMLLARDPGALILAESESPAGSDTGSGSDPGSGFDGEREIVGTVVAGWDGWRGAIYRLAVAPSARRGGIARALLHAAEERLAALGARRMHAIVVGSNAPAVAFWEASDWGHQEGQRRYAKG